MVFPPTSQQSGVMHCPHFIEEQTEPPREEAGG